MANLPPSLLWPRSLPVLDHPGEGWQVPASAWKGHLRGAWLKETGASFQNRYNVTTVRAGLTVCHHHPQFCQLRGVRLFAPGCTASKQDLLDGGPAPRYSTPLLTKRPSQFLPWNLPQQPLPGSLSRLLQPHLWVLPITRPCIPCAVQIPIVTRPRALTVQPFLMAPIRRHAPPSWGG